MITALLFYEFSGSRCATSATNTGCREPTCSEWHQALEADGSLADIMATLKLEPASALARRRGGRPFYHRDQAMVAAVAELRLQNFAEALRAGRR
jgi:hypothetical protein